MGASPFSGNNKFMVTVEHIYVPTIDITKELFKYNFIYILKLLLDLVNLKFYLPRFRVSFCAECSVFILL